jgi:hypothetical protein
MAVAVVALAIVVALLTVLVAGLLRSHAEVIKALHDAGIGIDPDREHGVTTPLAPPRGGPLAIPGRTAAEGATAGSLTGTDPNGEPLAVSLTGQGSTLLAFLTTSCLTCRTFWDAFADPTVALPAGARLVIVTKGPEEEQPEAIVRLAPPRAVTLRSSEAWATLGVPVAPFFMLFGPEGRVVGEGAAASWDQVVKLLTQSLADDELVRDDAELRAAGVVPGHSTLRPGAQGGDAPSPAGEA